MTSRGWVRSHCRSRCLCRVLGKINPEGPLSVIRNGRSGACDRVPARGLHVVVPWGALPNPLVVVMGQPLRSPGEPAPRRSVSCRVRRVLVVLLLPGDRDYKVTSCHMPQVGLQAPPRHVHYEVACRFSAVGCRRAISRDLLISRAPTILETNSHQ